MMAMSIKPPSARHRVGRESSIPRRAQRSKTPTGGRCFVYHEHPAIRLHPQKCLRLHDSSRLGAAPSRTANDGKSAVDHPSAAAPMEEAGLHFPVTRWPVGCG